MGARSRNSSAAGSSPKRASSKRAPSRPTTRGRRSSPAPVDDDSDEDGDLVDLVDEDVSDELELFLRKPPVAADHVVVVAETARGIQVVQDRSAAEARRAPVQLARSISLSSDQWAHVEERRTMFRASWMRGDQVVAAHQWVRGKGDDPKALDGSVESFLRQNQRFLENAFRMTMEYAEITSGNSERTNGLLHKENISLREEIERLRERLRKVDDVGAELAVEQQRVEMETRSRMADIIENRVLPIGQMLLTQHLQAAAAAPSAPQSAPAGANGNNQQ